MNTDKIQAIAKRTPFQFSMHISMTNKHLRTYHNESLNIYCEISTAYRKGKPGKPKRAFQLGSSSIRSELNQKPFYLSLTELFQAEPELCKMAEKLYPETSV
jgi:hypothetical protein